MHIPDGFLDPPTCVAGGLLAAALIAASVRRAAATLDDRQVPMAGLVAAFVFVLQMLNFPVAGGTSGHLLGGCLAAVLVGPWIGGLVMAVIITVQALLFADGGLTALGVNIVLMGYATCFVGYVVLAAIRKVLPRNRFSLAAGAAVGAWSGVVAASLLFVAFYAVGGAGDISISVLTVAMVSVHALIGIGEGVTTVAVVAAVSGTRPDLVHGSGLRTPSPMTAGGTR